MNSFEVKSNINGRKLSKKRSSHYVSYVVWCRGDVIRGPARDWRNNRLPPAATPATPGYVIYIYVIWLLGGGLEVRSGYYYMAMRLVYLSVSTHTLIPSPYLLLYPLRGASRVTHMLD